jgi:hypothetical protein
MLKECKKRKAGKAKLIKVKSKAKEEISEEKQHAEYARYCKSNEIRKGN